MRPVRAVGRTIRAAMLGSAGGRNGEAVRGGLLLGVVVVGGAVLRFWRLGAQSFWYDEWLTIGATSGGPLDLARHIADREGHPPLYFLLIWIWSQIFGDGEVALRSVSALAGVATIPVVYAVVRELGLARRVALAAALLVSVNPMLIWYSQEARPYSLLALLGAVSLLAFARLWRRGGRREWGLWSASCAVLVAVHYFAAFVVAAEAVALLVALRQPAANAGDDHAEGSDENRDQAGDTTVAGAGPLWRRIGLALVPSLVVLAVVAPVAVRQHSHEANRRWITAFPVFERFTDAGRSALVGPSPPNDRLWIVAALVVALAALLLTVGAGRGPRTVGRVMAVIAAVAVALPLAATAVGVDVVLGRHLIAAVMPLAVAVAAGLTAVEREGGRRWAQWGLPSRPPVSAQAPAQQPPQPRPRSVPGASTLAGLAGLLVLVVVSVVAVVAVARDPDLQRAEWRQVAEGVEVSNSDGDGRRVLVVNVHGDMANPLRHYLEGSRRLGGDEAVRVDGVDVLVAKGSDRPCNLLVGRGCGMIFLGAPPPDPLARELRLVEQVDLDQFRIDRYRATSPARVTADDLVSPTDRPGALVLVVPEGG